jgi:hypothetical protein
VFIELATPTLPERGRWLALGAGLELADRYPELSKQEYERQWRAREDDFDRWLLFDSHTILTFKRFSVSFGLILTGEGAIDPANACVTAGGYSWAVSRIPPRIVEGESN